MERNADKRNRMLAAAAKFEAQERQRKKRLVRSIIMIACLAIAVLLIDAFTRSKGAVVPLDFNKPEESVDKWLHLGFVKAIDTTTGAVVVDDAIWKEMSVGERKAVVTLILAYYREKSPGADYRLTVKGHPSQSLLAIIDERGISVK